MRASTHRALREHPTRTVPRRRAARGTRQPRHWARVHVIRISSKGQFTIPVALCRHLGIKPGDRVEIRLHGTDAFELRTLPQDERPTREQGGDEL